MGKFRQNSGKFWPKSREFWTSLANLEIIFQKFRSIFHTLAKLAGIFQISFRRSVVLLLGMFITEVGLDASLQEPFSGLVFSMADVVMFYSCKVICSFELPLSMTVYECQTGAYGKATGS